MISNSLLTLNMISKLITPTFLSPMQTSPLKFKSHVQLNFHSWISPYKYLELNTCKMELLICFLPPTTHLRFAPLHGPPCQEAIPPCAQLLRLNTCTIFLVLCLPTQPPRQICQPGLSLCATLIANLPNPSFYTDEVLVQDTIIFYLDSSMGRKFHAYN